MTQLNNSTIPIAAFVSRHVLSPQELADFTDYTVVQVNPPGRIDPTCSWLDICIACHGRPDLVVPVLPHEWLTPFVKHIKRMSPQTRIIRHDQVQYDGVRFDWNGKWLEIVLYKDGTRRVAWTPERVQL